MITKSELIEYLKHTPENTNYNILRSGLYNGSNKEAVDEFIEVLSRGNLSLAALQPYLAKLYEDDKTISPEPLPPFSSGGGGASLTDDDILECLIDTDMLSAVADNDGAILTDENNKILLM